MFLKIKNFFNKNNVESSENTIVVPGENEWFKNSFMMDLCDEKDQVAREVMTSGWQSFEKPMPYYFAEVVKKLKQGLFVDVGANTGFYSLLALSVSKAMKVDMYEPMNEVFEILEKNIALNKFSKRASLFPYAVSDVSGNGTLYIPDNGHGLIETSASLSSAFKESIMEGRDIKKVTLDEVYKDHKNLKIIKIDAETHDLEVLRGAKNVMMKNRPIIFIEVLLGADEAALTELLTNASYKDYVLFPDGISAPGKRIVHETLAWNHMLVPEEMEIAF